MTKLTGGQEKINKLKDLVAENVQNGYNLEFHHNIKKTACFDYMENNFVNACILQFLLLENHQVRVVPPNGGHSLVSQDNKCWEVNKGLQTHRIQSLF